MTRYKVIDMSPKLIPVDSTRQILLGSFEYAVCYLIDHEVDLSALAARYRNEEGGAPTYAPALAPVLHYFQPDAARMCYGTYRQRG